MDIINIDQIRKKQECNKIIAEKKDVFFAVYNKTLDMIYNDIDSGAISNEALDSLKGIAKDLELTRKKIQNGASLDENEILHTILSAQYVCSDMAARAENLALAAKELNEIIENLTLVK
jgi:hypothetical protein